MFTQFSAASTAPTTASIIAKLSNQEGLDLVPIHDAESSMLKTKAREYVLNTIWPQIVQQYRSKFEHMGGADGVLKDLTAFIADQLKDPQALNSPSARKQLTGPIGRYHTALRALFDEETLNYASLLHKGSKAVENGILLRDMLAYYWLAASDPEMTFSHLLDGEVTNDAQRLEKLHESKEIFISILQEIRIARSEHSPRCNLVFISLPLNQRLLGELLMQSNAAYIRSGNQLFYINKVSQVNKVIPKCTEILIDNTKLKHFDEVMQKKDRIGILSSEELIKITLITGHIHSLPDDPSCAPGTFGRIALRSACYNSISSFPSPAYGRIPEEIKNFISKKLQETTSEIKIAFDHYINNNLMFENVDEKDKKITLKFLDHLEILQKELLEFLQTTTNLRHIKWETPGIQNNIKQIYVIELRKLRLEESSQVNGVFIERILKICKEGQSQLALEENITPIITPYKLKIWKLQNQFNILKRAINNELIRGLLAPTYLQSDKAKMKQKKFSEILIDYQTSCEKLSNYDLISEVTQTIPLGTEGEQKPSQDFIERTLNNLILNNVKKRLKELSELIPELCRKLLSTLTESQMLESLPRAPGFTKAKYNQTTPEQWAINIMRIALETGHSGKLIYDEEHYCTLLSMLTESQILESLPRAPGFTKAEYNQATPEQWAINIMRIALETGHSGELICDEREMKRVIILMLSSLTPEEQQLVLQKTGQYLMRINVLSERRQEAIIFIKKVINQFAPNLTLISFTQEINQGYHNREHYTQLIEAEFSKHQDSNLEKFHKIASLHLYYPSTALDSSMAINVGINDRMQDAYRQWVEFFQSILNTKNKEIIVGFIILTVMYNLKLTKIREEDANYLEWLYTAYLTYDENKLQQTRLPYQFKGDETRHIQNLLGHLSCLLTTLQSVANLVESGHIRLITSENAHQAINDSQEASPYIIRISNDPSTLTITYKKDGKIIHYRPDFFANEQFSMIKQAPYDFLGKYFKINPMTPHSFYECITTFNKNHALATPINGMLLQPSTHSSEEDEHLGPESTSDQISQFDRNLYQPATTISNRYSFK